LKTARRKRDGFMVSPVLHYGVFGLPQMNRRELQVYQEEQGRRRRRRCRRSGDRTLDTIRRKKNLIYPMVYIKQVTIHSSIH
jgi:hypothetical protein